MKNLIISVLAVIILVLLLPAAITVISDNVGKNVDRYVSTDDELPIIAWASQTEAEQVQATEITSATQSNTKSSTLEFEDYIKGVVAAEMPITFNIEALKAQAVAARTYALKKMKAANISNPLEISGQAYVDVENLQDIWGINFETYYSKLTLAVNSTKGQIMTYDDALIEAVFHSTSSGITEASQNVWSAALPYLVSVESSYDKYAPDFIFEQSFDVDYICQKLTEIEPKFELTEYEFLSQTEIQERSDAGYVLKIKIGNTVFKGTQVRQALGLRSADFEISKGSSSDREILFTTKGYGHGVGMSQYGADFLAQQGKNYIQILKTYYQGVEVVLFAD